MSQAAQAQAAPPPSSLSISPSKRWTIVTLLCVGYVIAYFDRVNLSAALADSSFKDFFKLTDIDRGTLGSAFFWSYAVLQIPAGWFVDKYGVKWPYAGGFFVWSLLSAGTAFATSMRELVFLRVALGFGESMITPAGMRWIRLNCAENQRDLFIGLYMAAAKAGPALGGLVAALLLHSYGWRAMFLIMGFGGLLWLIPWALLVTDNDRQIEQQIRRESPKTADIPFTRILFSPVILGTIIGTFCYQYFVYFSMTWLPAYLKERRGLDLTNMGLFTFFSFIGMAVVATAAGYVADRLIDRGYDPVKVRKGFIIAGFLTASTEVIGGLSDSQSVALFFAVFSLSGLGLMTANYWALTQTLLPGAAIGRIVGVQNCAANIPGIVAPMLTGWLKETTGRYDAPMVAIFFFLLMGIAAYVTLVREKYVPKAGPA
ncbi:MAG: MFS transporter [Bryobacterales bacterium]|nr:MFS transporter [Bryobacterales bacterium]